MMMQATDFWKFYDPSMCWQLHRSRFWTILLQRQMRAPTMIILEIGRQNPFQMSLVQHDDMAMWSKYSCGFPMIIFQQPTQAFFTAN
jgi:hypothetical protein